jgi:hypothetical protein
MISNQPKLNSMSSASNNTSFHTVLSHSALNKSALSSNGDFSMNQTVNSEVAMIKLEENLRQLSNINEKLQ